MTEIVQQFNSLKMSQGEIQEVAYSQNNARHRTYLVTYSQLDYRKFPTCWSFGGAVIAAFGAKNVDYFVAAKENHETSSTGYHYHLAFRIIKPMLELENCKELHL